MAGPQTLEPRGSQAAPLVFKSGAHAPYAIRWYGATSLWGHFRNLVSSAIASESIDSRDWMRPLGAQEMLAGLLRVLGLPPRATLLEALDRPLWIDWVADTGDDRDVSQAVGRMLFAEYTVDDGGAPLRLPRGEVLLFGGDTAYPVATADEIYRRVVQPWNELLDGLDEPRDRPRVLLGIPGNHDWYDGLDGFGRFFRQSPPDEEEEPDEPASADAASLPTPKPGRNVGLLARGLHLDEVGGTLQTIADAAKATRAMWRGRGLRRRSRLTLHGYEPVQESSYWALPLAPGLDLWGVDRQLGGLDYRQRVYFQARRRAVGEEARIWFVAPDPALAFGEPWDFGQRMLRACNLSLEGDRVLYQCGDLHQYERREVGRSLHVIAGGGGAFLHGTRIVSDPSPAACAYPDGKTTRQLALQVPVRLMLGRAGYLVHIAAGLIASLELGVGWHHIGRFAAVSLAVTAAFVWFLYAIAGHQRAQPGRVLALAIPFGAALGLLPLLLSALLHDVAGAVPLLGRDTVVMIACAFSAAFLFGVFLTLCALAGLEMQQVFTVLGHPGFKHFVRMRVSPGGTIDAWVIGKDDPLAPGGPWLVDRWTWGNDAGSDASGPADTPAPSAPTPTA
jgi:hypothetical protein